MIQIRLAEHDSELAAVRALQTANLRRNLGEVEATEQGFLIAEYDLEYLRQMHAHQPSVIAVEGGRVVGYVLAAVQAVRSGHPLLCDLFTQIDRLEFQGRPLAGADYVVVGQVCVARGYRGAGLLRRMYACFRESMQGRYRYAITDIAQANPRSLQAHLKAGFQIIHAIEFEGRRWDVVLWDWTLGPAFNTP